MLKLIIEDDEGKTTVVPLIRDEITIGRKEGNTIRLTERNVSRRHAKILRKNGQTLLEDLESYNGIKVNGNRIQGQIAVAEGDRIQIGDYQLALKTDQPEAAATPQADPFDEMKTVPVEKAEAKAMAAHMASAPAGAAPAAPAPAPPAAPAPAPPAAPAPAPAPALTAEPVPDSQPTQRVHRDLIAEAAEAAKAPDVPARLVVTSANFAGLECALDKAAQVIGRTEDNDIAINHRSISRHHAKIIREETKYTIIDQASANGVFVNGEKYDRVELQAGDLVDLGHVRMRFVAPGEEFTFDPSTAEDIFPAGKRSKTGLYTVIGIIVVGAGAVGILAATGAFSGKKKKGGEESASSGPGTMVPGESDGGPAADPKAYTAIRQDTADKKWPDCIKKADALLIKSSGDAEARRLKEKCLEEQKNLEHRNRFFEALKSGNRSKAIWHGSQVSKDSVYYREIKDRLAQAKKTEKQKLLALAEKAKKHKQCDKLREYGKKYESIDPEDTRIREWERSCRQNGGNGDTMGVEPPEPMRPMRREPHRRRPPMDRPMEPDMRERPRTTNGGGATSLYKQARKAWLSGQCGRAIKLAQAANKARYASRHTVIIGICACTLRNKSRARWAYKLLRGGQRNNLMQFCQTKGITLP